MNNYRIVRYYKNRAPRIIKTGLSLEEARLHCNDRTTHKIDKSGNVVWFDGYTQED